MKPWKAISHVLAFFLITLSMVCDSRPREFIRFIPRTSGNSIRLLEHTKEQFYPIRCPIVACGYMFQPDADVRMHRPYSLRGGGITRFNAFHMDERQRDSTSDEESSRQPATRGRPTRHRGPFSEDEAPRAAPTPRNGASRPAARAAPEPPSDSDAGRGWGRRGDEDEEDEEAALRRRIAGMPPHGDGGSDNSDEESGAVREAAAAAAAAAAAFCAERGV